MHSQVFSLLLVLAIISPYFCTSYPYHYLKLALTWPPGFCTNRNCIRPIPQNFTIHGLWPTNTSLPFFSSCPSGGYSRKDPGNPQWPGLARSWPNLKVSGYPFASNNNKFWSRQWREHGMCSTGTFNETQYFAKAMELRDRFDYLGQLQNKGMRRKKLHPISFITAYLRQIVGYDPDLGCESDRVKNRWYLEEIRICFDVSGTNVIDCPTDNGFVLAQTCLQAPNYDIYFS